MIAGAPRKFTNKCVNYALLGLRGARDRRWHLGTVDNPDFQLKILAYETPEIFERGRVIFSLLLVVNYGLVPEVIHYLSCRRF